MKTKNTYQAAFFIMFGASLIDIKVRKVQENKIEKKEYRRECVIYLNNVPRWAKEVWDSGYIYGDLVKFSQIREKLKKTMRKILRQERGIGFRA